MRGGSQRAFCQSRRLASKDNEMLLMRRMEDSSLRLICNCRLWLADLRSTPYCGGSRLCAHQVAKRDADL